MTRQTFIVDLTQHGMRLDHFISTALGSLSKRRAKSLVDDGDVFVNGSRQKIASYLLKKGDQVAVTTRETASRPAARKEFYLTDEALLYLDENLVIINKPAGLNAQPTRDPAVPHVVTVLTEFMRSRGDDHRTLLPVHRLDKETTGCLVVARNRQSMSYMTDLFRRHAITKLYHALCYGMPPHPFTEKAALSMIHPATGRVQVVRSGGRFAQTAFTPLERFAAWNLALVACQPLTGRSHQIRVHLEKNGYPIVGDKVYGNPANEAPLPASLLTLLDHHMLHASTITFVRPGEKICATVTAPYPASLQQLLTLCRSQT